MDGKRLDLADELRAVEAAVAGAAAEVPGAHLPDELPALEVVR
jgi:hypothetical protein